MKWRNEQGKPVPATLGQVLAHTVAVHGQAEAYVGPDERQHWHDLDVQARRLAKALLAAGIQRGDHVGLMLGNSGTWMASFFACALVGAVTVPVNTRFKADDLLFCLKQSRVRMLVYADQFLGIDFSALLRQVEPAVGLQLPGQALPQLEQLVVVSGHNYPATAQTFEAFVAAGAALDDAALAERAAQVQPHDVLLIQYTSGTTSFPKGVMLSHANMLGDAAAVVQRMGVQASDRYFSIRPFFHVAGSTLSVLVALSAGCCLLSMPKFDVGLALKTLEQERCTLTSGNDTIFLMLMGHPDFDAERLSLTGGWAAVGPEVMQKIHDFMRVPHMCNAYGQSEASPNVLMSDRYDAFELRRDGFMLPHPGLEVRLVDEASGQTVAPGAGQGEIQVRGWSVMRGYYEMPEATAKVLGADGWLRTGDLGEQRADGRLRMVGRLKDMYRVGGENVAPAEVEEVLHSHPAVQQAQVIGVPDARLGEVTGAFVLLKSGQHASREELVGWCKQRCANFKVPKYLDLVETFDHIGMTGSSKVQKNKLREHAIALWNIQSDTVAA